MKVFMLIDNDKYQLPIAIGDSLSDLSKAVGKGKSWAYNMLRYQGKSKFKSKKTRIIEVEI